MGTTGEIITQTASSKVGYLLTGEEEGIHSIFGEGLA